jgi:hypothetical protein
MACSRCGTPDRPPPRPVEPGGADGPSAGATGQRRADVASGVVDTRLHGANRDVEVPGDVGVLQLGQVPQHERRDQLGVLDLQPFQRIQQVQREPATTLVVRGSGRSTGMSVLRSANRRRYVRYVCRASFGAYCAGPPHLGWPAGGPGPTEAHRARSSYPSASQFPLSPWLAWRRIRSSPGGENSRAGRGDRPVTTRGERPYAAAALQLSDTRGRSRRLRSHAERRLRRRVSRRRGRPR